MSIVVFSPVCAAAVSLELKSAANSWFRSLVICRSTMVRIGKSRLSDAMLLLRISFSFGASEMAVRGYWRSQSHGVATRVKMRWKSVARAQWDADGSR